MKKSFFISLVVTVVFIISCSDDSNSTPVKLSSENDIKIFKLISGNNLYNATIQGDSIFYKLPPNVDRGNLKTDIVISEKAKVSPESGKVVDFTNSVKYTVTAENGNEKYYNVSINNISSDASIYNFEFINLPDGQTSYPLINKIPSDIDTIYCNIPALSPIRKLKSEINIHKNSTISPESGEELDYTSPVKYTVKAEDGTKKEYLVIADLFIPALSYEKEFYKNIVEGNVGDVVSIEVNVLNQIFKEQNIVYLVDEKDNKIKLEIDKFDFNTNEVFVKIPNYDNGNYRILMYIEDDNFIKSESFYLSKGEIRFLGVMPRNTQNNSYQVDRVFIPGPHFNAKFLIDFNRFNDYSFSLIKNGKIINFSKIEYSGSSNIGFYLPKRAIDELNSGKDYIFLVKDKKYDKVFEFDFTNSKGDIIEIIIPKPLENLKVNKTVLTKDEKLIVKADNLFYDLKEGESFGTPDKIQLSTNFVSGIRQVIESSEILSDGSVVFSLENMVTGSFDITVVSNLPYHYDYSLSLPINKAFEGTFSEKVTINFPESGHSSLEIIETRLFGEGERLAKQFLILFNQNIEKYEIKKVVVENYRFNNETQSYEDLSIENFLIQGGDKILTGILNEEQFRGIILKDGYVLVNDEGKDYRIYFKVNN